MKVFDYTQEEFERFRRMQVAILTPVLYDYPRFWTSVVNMVAYSWHSGLRVEEIAITERTVVDWARNDLAREALKRRSIYTGELYTHFLWLDSDEIFKADLACQLARHGKQMVSGLYFKRLKDPTPLAYVANREDPEGLAHFPILEMPPQLCEVDAFGFGCCMMAREVLETVPEPWFTIDWRAGEDIAFCAKARRHGIRLHVDGAYTVAHIGAPRIVTRAEYEQWYSDNRERIESDRVEIELGGDRHGRAVVAQQEVRSHGA